MTFDPATQAIARFIGLFDLKIEELRLRDDYHEFKLKQAAAKEAPPMEPVGVRLQAPHELGRYDPALAYEPEAPELPPVDHGSSAPRIEPVVLAPPRQEFEGPDDISADSPAVVVMDVDFVPPSYVFPIEIPGSIYSMTVQLVRLSDNDLFLSGLGTRFVDPAVLEEALGGAVALAETLAGFDMPDLPKDGDWIGFAKDMLARLDDAPAAEGSAEIATFRGAEAQGIIVDGVAVDEAPDWQDLLPEYLRPEEEEEEEAATAGQAPGLVTDGETVSYSTDGLGGNGTVHSPEHDFSRDFNDDAPNPFKLNPGHEIVAGANKAINEIAIGSNWLDAPVIVVSGNVARFDAVSQVNVLVEHDTVDGLPVGQASVGHNIVEIITESSEDPDAPDPANVLPSAWQVIRVEADIIQVNWVKQFTYITDFDRAEVTFSGSATYLGLGKNDVVNSAVLNELGYNYDLIFVAGDMVDATVVSQKNVLFDSDKVMTRDPDAVLSAKAEAERMEESSERPDVSAEAAREATEHSTEAVQALHHQGDGLRASDQIGQENPSDADEHSPERDEADESASLQSLSGAASAAAAKAGALEVSTQEPAGPPEPTVEHVADPGDSEPEAPVAETDPAPDHVTSPEPEASPALSLADNLLLNKTTLKTTGADKVVEMKATFAETAERLAEGAETIAREVAEDALFAGKEALRVLQIDGDLAKINLFEQTNIVGDADQIRLEMAALKDRLEAEIKLIAGSNALLNLATVMEHGVDSTVMAGGHVYDDAFIHQAELFDTDAAPTGVAVSGLASEAVAAFLSDDMIKAVEATDEIVPTGNYEGTSQLDVMQTALT